MPVTNTLNLEQIISVVSRFYTDAWSSLVTVTAAILTASIAIVGVVIPLVISYYQRKQQSADFGKMLMVKDAEIQTQIDSLKGQVTKELESKFDSLREDFKKIVQESEATWLQKLSIAEEKSAASVLHVQGLIWYFRNDYLEGLASFVGAAAAYNRAKSDYNLHVVVENIVKSLKGLNNVDTTSKEWKSVNKHLHDLIENLRTPDSNGGSRRIADNIESELHDFLKKRAADQGQPNTPGPRS